MSDRVTVGETPRTLALAGRHREAGARFAPFAGWEMPLQYEGIIAEHEAVRTHAGVFDVSHMGRSLLRGAEVSARLRFATTRDVTVMQPGDAQYSLYCTEQGGIADDVFVYRIEPERWLVVHNAANAAADHARLAAALEGHDGTADDVTEATVMLAVQGPAAVRLATDVLDADLDALAARSCRELEWRGGALLVGRTGYTGEDGVEVIAPPEQGGALWDALLRAGVRPCGLGARDTLRLEAALPLHGNDIDETTDPYAARLGWAVTLDDGAPFIGREALARLAEREPERRLACIRLEDRGVPRHGYAVFERGGGEAVAALTSGAYAPTLRTGIGMAYLPRGLTRPGTALSVDLRGRRVDAVVVRRPFYRREQ